MLVVREKCFAYTEPFIHAVQFQSHHINYHVKLDYIMPIKDGSHVEFHTLNKEALHIKTDMQRVKLTVASQIEGAIDYGRIEAVNCLIRDMQVTVMKYIYDHTDTVMFRYNTKLKRWIHKWFGIGKVKRLIYKILKLTDAIKLKTLGDAQTFFNSLLIKHNSLLLRDKIDQFDRFIIIGFKHVNLLTLLPNFHINHFGERSHNMLPYHLGTLHGAKVYVDPELELNDARVVIGHRPKSTTHGTVVVYTQPEILETVSESMMQRLCHAQAYYSIVDFGQPTKYYAVDVEYK